MSTSYTIHIRPTSSVSTEVFVKDAIAAIGTDLTPSACGEGFEGFTPAGAIDIFTDGPSFDDEGNIPLSLYPWFIEMVKPKADEDRDRRVLATLRSIYRELASTGRYLCCFLIQFSALVATNDPAVTAVPTEDHTR